jgi:hypothetical protein
MYVCVCVDRPLVIKYLQIILKDNFASQFLNLPEQQRETMLDKGCEGFIAKFDQNMDGNISLEEYKVVFAAMKAGAAQAGK